MPRSNRAQTFRGQLVGFLVVLGLVAVVATFLAPRSNEDSMGRSHTTLGEVPSAAAPARTVTAVAQAGDAFDPPPCPDVRGNSWLTNSIGDRAIPKEEIAKTLAYRGPTTRYATFDLEWPYYTVGDHFALEPTNLRNLDLILSSLGVPYFIGKYKSFRPSEPVGARVIIPCDPDNLRDCTRLIQALDFIYAAAASDVGLVKSHPFAPDPPFTKYVYPPSEPTAEERERAKYHPVFYFSKRRTELQQYLDHGRTPPPGWRMPTELEEAEWERTLVVAGAPNDDEKE